VPLLRLPSALILLVLAVAGGRTPAAAGPPAAQGLEIASFRFEGNETVSDDELLSAIRSRETPGAIGKFFHSINEYLGRKNEYFDAAVFAEDMTKIRAALADRGFLQSTVDSLVEANPADSTVAVTVRIQEGPRASVRTLEVRGLVNVPEFVFTDIAEDRRIAAGMPYDRLALESELDRILLVLANAGFNSARFVPDSSGVFYSRLANTCDVVYTFDLGKRYRWGGVDVRQDSVGDRPVIDEEVVREQMDFAPGDVYSRISQQESITNLNRLAIFDRVELDVRFPPAHDTSVTAPVTVTVRAREKHELAPELIISDEDRNFNIGAGLQYTNRNFFGGGRLFSGRARFRTATLSSFPDFFGSDTISIANSELTFDVIQPYLFSSNRTKGGWLFSFIVDKQKLTRREIVRNKVGLSDRVATYTTMFLDWTLEVLKTVINQGAEAVLTPAELERLRAEAAATQLNSILSFTITRDRADEPFSPSTGFIHTARIDESGLLAEAIRGAVPRYTYTQFWSVTLLGRWYADLSGDRFTILALKLKAGYEDKYGGSRAIDTRSIPSTYRFYAGGGGSIRAWGPRQLSARGNPDLGGNVLLEGSVEWRVNVFRGLRDETASKVWLVPFVDVGNMWPTSSDLSFSTVAAAAGLGFRYDTIFGPFRLDYGIRVYDPGRPPGERWITERSFFRTTLSLAESYFSFGIGHAF
jgi:outer membrane protein assembly factor BamA